MKKTIIILLLALALGLAGCENNTKKSVNNQTTSAETTDKSNATEQTTSNNEEKSNTDNQTTSNNQEKPNTNNQSNSNTQSSSNTKSNNFNQESKKQEYKAKLDKIELEFKGFDDAAATTNDMYQKACKEYKQWDDALNEIYGVLKVQLSESDMKGLQREEIQWIKDRDAKAKNDAAEMAGGSMEKVLYQGSLAKSTKERCYVLVDKYMK